MSKAEENEENHETNAHYCDCDTSHSFVIDNNPALHEFSNIE
jgi:hypothetical protein